MLLTDVQGWGSKKNKNKKNKSKGEKTQNKSPKSGRGRMREKGGLETGV